VSLCYKLSTDLCNLRKVHYGVHFVQMLVVLLRCLTVDVKFSVDQLSETVQREGEGRACGGGGGPVTGTERTRSALVNVDVLL
jgi:hypothetical protein